jgi:hypothetical protein
MARAGILISVPGHSRGDRAGDKSGHVRDAAKDGFAPIDRTEVALVASPDARLADRLAELCENVQARVDRIDQ